MSCIICSVAKNENHYIREWVEHYKQLGFEKIFLYDNNDVSGEHFEEVINDYIESGFVVIYDVRGLVEAQIQSFDKFYHSDECKKYDWVFFCDTDEFLQLEFYKNINDFVTLDKFKNFNAIAINWKNYDDNDLITVQNNNYSVKRFTRVLNDISNRTNKKIIRTNILNVNLNSSHVFNCNAFTLNSTSEYLDKRENILNILTYVKCCDVFGIHIYPTIWTPTIIHSVAWINHYRFKTLEEYLTNKMPKGYATWYKNRGKDFLTIDTFFVYNRKTEAKVNFYNNFVRQQNQKTIKLFYWNKIINAGDYYGQWILKKLLPFHNIVRVDINPDLITCGSIIGFNAVSPNTIVWSCGIHNSHPIFNICRSNDSNIYALRGKLSQSMLTSQGHRIEHIALGDSGLLASKFYQPINKIKKYKYGILAHFSDYDTLKRMYPNENIISMGTTDIESVFEFINSCEFIFSSSLHGIIFSHSFGIPAIHVEQHMLESKDNFKFKDYYSVLDIDYVKEDINHGLDFIQKYLDNKDNYKPSKDCIEKIQTDLLKSFPYFRFDSVSVMTLNSQSTQLTQTQSTVIPQNHTNKVIGIISYLPNDSKLKIARLTRFKQLLIKIKQMFNLDVMIIAQNYTDEDIEELKKVYDKLIIHRYTTSLYIAGAREELRRKFLESKYEYIILLDDDSQLAGVDGSKYLTQIQNNPGKMGMYIKSQHKLMSFHREAYKLLPYDLRNTPENHLAFEDRLYTWTFVGKYPQLVFKFNNIGIGCASEVTGSPISSWSKNVNSQTLSQMIQITNKLVEKRTGKDIKSVYALMGYNYNRK